MHLRLAAVAALTLAICAAPAAAPAAEPPLPTVARDVLAGADPLPGGTDLFGQFSEADTALEPSIAVNPANSDNAVVAFMEGLHQNAAGSQNIGYATTFDAGRTWVSGTLRIGMVAGGSYTFASDPYVAFGPHNEVYVSFIGLDTTLQANQGIGMVRSSDGGRTWSDALTVDGGSQFHDTDSIVVDVGTGPGHHPGRIYAAWTVATPFGVGLPVATYSDDSGDSWQAVPSPVATGSGLVTSGFDDRVVVLADGSMGLLYDTGADAPPGSIGNYVEKYFFARATASALPGQPLVFSPPVAIGSASNNPDPENVAALDPASVVVDPVSGAITVGWADGRFRTERENPVNDIVLSRSSDGGASWSAPVRVTGGATDDHVDHFMPALTLTQGGALRVAYRQHRRTVDPATPSWTVDTFIQQANLDGTFSVPRRVNSVVTDLRFAANQGGQYLLGDYAQAATAGKYTLVARAEAYSTVAGESADWPPSVTHQRIWVAAVK